MFPANPATHMVDLSVSSHLFKFGVLSRLPNGGGCYKMQNADHGRMYPCSCVASYHGPTSVLVLQGKFPRSSTTTSYAHVQDMQVSVVGKMVQKAAPCHLGPESKSLNPKDDSPKPDRARSCILISSVYHAVCVRSVHRKLPPSPPNFSLVFEG